MREYRQQDVRRAVLLITHRPEGLDAVDQVVTLDAGRVVAPSPPAA